MVRRSPFLMPVGEGHATGGDDLGDAGRDRLHESRGAGIRQTRGGDSCSTHSTSRVELRPAKLVSKAPRYPFLIRALAAGGSVGWRRGVTGGARRPALSSAQRVFVVVSAESWQNFCARISRAIASPSS